MAEWRHALLKSLGYKPTKQNLTFLANWQRWEGGHTNNGASYNWLNTTMDAPGNLGSINSVGVKKFKNFQYGIQAIASTLNNGRYQDILNGLASGNPYAGDVGRGLQVWVSGRPDGNPTYASNVLGGKYEAPPGPSRTIKPRLVKPGVVRPSRSREDVRQWNTMIDLVFEGDPFFKSLLEKTMEPPAPLYRKAKAAQTVGKATTPNGKTLQLTPDWVPTHVTDGLGWGTKSAVDIMGSPGTAVLAPEDGKVIYYHPTGAQGGGSMLIRTPSGREYWLGHIDGGARAGTIFHKGQRIAAISADHPRPHVHIDKRG